MQGPRELRQRRCPESQVEPRDKPSLQAGSPTSSKPVIPEPPRTHSQAGTSSKKSAFCVRSRCRSCRRMWRFQAATGAQGSQGAPGPAMAAESLAAARRSSPIMRGGASRGLHDVRAAAAGNPRAVPRAFVGEIWTSQSRCCCGRPKPSAPRKRVSVPGLSSRDRSLPDACERVQGGASESSSLTSLSLDQRQKLRMLDALEFPAGKTLPPSLSCTGTSTRHKQSNRKDWRSPTITHMVTVEREYMRDQLRSRPLPRGRGDKRTLKPRKEQVNRSDDMKITNAGRWWE